MPLLQSGPRGKPKLDELKPSTFVPLSRWFTNERVREDRELRALYDSVHSQHARSTFSAAEAVSSFLNPVWMKISDCIPETCQEAFAEALWRLTELETHIFKIPAPRFEFLNIKEAADLSAFLRRKQFFQQHEERVTDALKDSLEKLFIWLAGFLPQSEVPSPFTIPLVYVLPSKDVLNNLLGEFSQDKYREAGIYAELFRKLWFNICEASGIADPHDPGNRPLKRPSDLTLPLDKTVEAYFKSTPFYDLLLSPMPLKFAYEDRFSHMHVLGGSGAGKTTLLKNLILHDLQSEERPALVIVDSQGDLIRAVSHLRTDRNVILISPKDIDYPLALNIFDVKRLGHYTPAQKEQVVAGVIDTFDYLFSGLLGADLTAKQGVFFRFVARLMLALPETMGRNATIMDMIALMDDAGPYKDAIQTLPPIQRNFFERDFVSKTFAQTKEQIRYRLNAILENPTLARLFTATETKIDLFSELNAGSVILVDTAKDFLKSSSSHFGRIFISLVLQAVLERAALPESERYPAFLVVDEAAEYFDSNVDDLLTAVRKYSCGCVFSHQFLDQATPQLRASLAANTAIKFAAGVSMNDARAMASEMRTNADFILSQPKLQFAAFIRNVTSGAVSIPIEARRFEREPRLSPMEYDDFMESNRRAVSNAHATTKARSVAERDRSTTTSKASPVHLPNPKDPGTESSSEW